MQQCSIKTEHKKRNEEQKRWPREHRQQKVYEDMCSRRNVGACSTLTLHEVISTAIISGPLAKTICIEVVQ